MRTGRGNQRAADRKFHRKLRAAGWKWTWKGCKRGGPYFYKKPQFVGTIPVRKDLPVLPISDSADTLAACFEMLRESDKVSAIPRYTIAPMLGVSIQNPTSFVVGEA